VGSKPLIKPEQKKISKKAVHVITGRRKFETEVGKRNLKKKRKRQGFLGGRG